MLKVNNRSTRCHAGVFITTLNIFDNLCFFSNFEHVMADGILYCLNLNLSMYFRVGSRSPVTFKTNLYVTTVNNSFRLLASSLMLHRRELNNMTWSTKILKSIEGHLPPFLLSSSLLGKYEKLTLIDALKIHFQRFFALNIMHLL